MPNSLLSMLRPPLLPLPTVQLRHALPDGTHHVDWLIAVDSGGVQPLVTFRIEKPVDELAAGESLVAERLADHRPAYLEYEGPIAGGRGSVHRLVRGVVREVAPGEDAMRLTIEWELQPDSIGAEYRKKRQVFELKLLQLPQWLVSCVRVDVV